MQFLLTSHPLPTTLRIFYYKCVARVIMCFYEEPFDKETFKDGEDLLDEIEPQPC